MVERPTGAAADFSILVNSSDGFEDCWSPFFTLLARYWPGCQVPILLNTGHKAWRFPGLDIQCTQVEAHCPPGESLTWSQCLAAALAQVRTPLVLYMQEDYFLERRVDAALIADLAAHMVREPQIRRLDLTELGSSGPFTPTADPRLWKIPQRARYRISTQAGLWRVDALASYLRPWENGWMFEIFGTQRAHRRPELFLTVNRERYGSHAAPVMQYLHTGIIKGRWHPQIPDVFRRNDIQVSFAARGFHRPQPALLRRLELLRKLAAHPMDVARSMFG